MTQEQQQQETILSKVKKLLALAENNTSADESQNSFLKAQMLLLKPGLTMNDVAESKEDYRYRGMSEFEINNIFNNGKKVARFY